MLVRKADNPDLVAGCDRCGADVLSPAFAAVVAENAALKQRVALLERRLLEVVLQQTASPLMPASDTTTTPTTASS
jgi:hypothetical protein